MARGRRPRLHTIDEMDVVAAYTAGDHVQAICDHHGIALGRLYRILDRHQVERRRPNAPRIGERRRGRILASYRAGERVEDIARRHRVSPATVGNIAVKAGEVRQHQRTGRELVELVVAWFCGADLADAERDAIERVGVAVRQPGLRSLDTLEPMLAVDVRRRLAEQLTTDAPRSV
jgi:hypothetical protein